MPDDNTNKPDESGKTPEFEGEFDADRAKRLVANLRTDLEKAKADLTAATTSLQAREDAEKTDLEKALARITALESENTKVKNDAAKVVAAAKHNLPDDLSEFLTGDSPEEIEKKAEALAKFATKRGDGEQEPTEGDLPGKPKTRLVPGHQSDDGGAAFDPRAIANDISADGF